MITRHNATKAQIDAAVEEVRKVIAIGEKGTKGDYTELGALVYILTALGVEIREVPDDHVDTNYR